MTAGTFDTPFGRLRVGSMRRFILVRERFDGAPFVVKRSDTRATLERLAHTGDVILDTAPKRDDSWYDEFRRNNPNRAERF